MPGLTESSLRRVQRQVRRAEGGEFNNPPRRGEPHVPRHAGPRVVMLLEDCPSGARAECAILVEVESTETQIVEMFGRPIGGTFKLEFRGETTEAMPYNVTAAAMQSALESLSTINPGDVIVEIGPGAARDVFSIFRWLVSFTGQFTGSDVPLLVSREVDLLIAGFIVGAEGIQVDPVLVRSLPDVEDTGDTLRALCVTPLQEAVVIPAGAIGVALPIPTFGYCFITAECRDLDPGAEEPY